MIIIVSWAANQHIRVISEASYDPRVMMLKIQLCHHRNTFFKYIKIERYFTILQVLIKLMQPWWDFLKTAYGPQHFWSGVCVNIYIYRSSFIFCCSTHLGGRFHWQPVQVGGRRGLGPHDGSKSALLFDCRHHVSRREREDAWGTAAVGGKTGGGGHGGTGRNNWGTGMNERGEGLGRITAYLIDLYLW